MIGSALAILGFLGTFIYPKWPCAWRLVKFYYKAAPLPVAGQVWVSAPGNWRDPKFEEKLTIVSNLSGQVKYYVVNSENETLHYLVAESDWLLLRRKSRYYLEIDDFMALETAYWGDEKSKEDSSTTDF